MRPQIDAERFTAMSFGEKVAIKNFKVHHAFESVALKSPELVAIRDSRGNEISYGDLNRKAEELSNLLRMKGVAPGDKIGLFLERSIEMIIGILGVLKAGAAYVPQDARISPPKLLKSIISDCDSKIILTLKHLRYRIPTADGVELVSLDAPLFLDGPRRFTTVEEGDDSCFVLFTSGTTGRPNGVIVTHSNVTNLILNSPGNLGVKKGEKVAQLLNISFDMAAWEIFTALSAGATLLIRGKSIEETATKANVLIATPSVLNNIDERKCPYVRAVAVAGEPCPRPLAKRWSVFCDFYNCCGPTEVTIVNTIKKYDPLEDALTIGRPVPNTSVYILDDELSPLPLGQVGEMWAGGACVTSGYLKNPKLTTERYRPDPFLGEGHYMFRTRDLARWTKAGELEHLGRTDDQVKIKGFRVELDSVSNTLEGVGGVSQAVTIKIDDRNLVSFVSPSQVERDALKKALEERLPYFYAPSIIVPLEELPKTVRGKIDKRLLTEIAMKELEKSRGHKGLEEVAC